MRGVFSFYGVVARGPTGVPGAAYEVLLLGLIGRCVLLQNLPV